MKHILMEIWWGYGAASIATAALLAYVVQWWAGNGYFGLFTAAMFAFWFGGATLDLWYRFRLGDPRAPKGK